MGKIIEKVLTRKNSNGTVDTLSPLVENNIVTSPVVLDDDDWMYREHYQNECFVSVGGVPVWLGPNYMLINRGVNSGHKTARKTCKITFDTTLVGTNYHAATNGTNTIIQVCYGSPYIRVIRLTSTGVEVDHLMTPNNDTAICGCAGAKSRFKRTTVLGSGDFVVMSEIYCYYIDQATPSEVANISNWHVATHGATASIAKDTRYNDYIVGSEYSPPSDESNYENNQQTTVYCITKGCNNYIKVELNQTKGNAPTITTAQISTTDYGDLLCSTRYCYTQTQQAPVLFRRHTTTSKLQCLFIKPNGTTTSADLDISMEVDAVKGYSIKVAALGTLEKMNDVEYVFYLAMQSTQGSGAVSIYRCVLQEGAFSPAVQKIATVRTQTNNLRIFESRNLSTKDFNAISECSRDIGAKNTSWGSICVNNLDSGKCQFVQFQFGSTSIQYDFGTVGYYSGLWSGVPTQYQTLNGGMISVGKQLNELSGGHAKVTGTFPALSSTPTPASSYSVTFANANQYKLIVATDTDGIVYYIFPNGKILNMRTFTSYYGCTLTQSGLQFAAVGTTGLTSDNYFAYTVPWGRKSCTVEAYK